MASRRHQHDPTCRFDQAEDCAALAVRRLGRGRVDELAEEIWTASGTGPRTWWWRVQMVITVALASGLLVGLSAGAGLGWRMAVLAAWAAGGADLLFGRHGETPRGRRASP